MAEMSSGTGWQPEARHQSSSRGRRISAYRQNGPADLISSFGSPANAAGQQHTHSSSFLSATPRGTEVSQLSAFTMSRTLSGSFARTPTSKVSLAFSRSIGEDNGFGNHSPNPDEQQGFVQSPGAPSAVPISDAQTPTVKRQASSPVEEEEARCSWLGSDESKSRGRPTRQPSGASWSTDWARPARSQSRDRLFDDVLEVQSLAASSCAVSTFAGTGNSPFSTLTLSQEDGAPSPVGALDSTSPRCADSASNGKGLCEQDLLDLLLEHGHKGSDSARRTPSRSEKTRTKGHSQETGLSSRARSSSRSLTGASVGALPHSAVSSSFQVPRLSSAPVDLGMSDSLDLELLRSSTPGQKSGRQRTSKNNAGSGCGVGTPKDSARTKDSARDGHLGVAGNLRSSSRGGDARQTPKSSTRRHSALQGTGRAICSTPT